jgi:putative DNA primase/helicase
MFTNKESPGGNQGLTKIDPWHGSATRDNSGIFSVDCQAALAPLIGLNQWVAWKSCPHPDPTKKKIKYPLNVHTGHGASTANPSTWATFQDVKAFLEEWAGSEHSHFDKQHGELTGPVIGPGFVFSKDDPYCGIDLDNCIDEQGNLLEWARKLVAYFFSYTEISHSGKGLHIIVEATKPEGARSKNGNIECYDRGRFFAITGNIFQGGGTHV